MPMPLDIRDQISVECHEVNKMNKKKKKKVKSILRRIAVISNRCQGNAVILK